MSEVTIDFDVPGRMVFDSLVCVDCGWIAAAPQLSGAKWQATKHAEREGCREFDLEMVETRRVRATPTSEGDNESP